MRRAHGDVMVHIRELVTDRRLDPATLTAAIETELGRALTGAAEPRGTLSHARIDAGTVPSTPAGSPDVAAIGRRIAGAVASTLGGPQPRGGDR